MSTTERARYPFRLNPLSVLWVLMPGRAAEQRIRARKASLTDIGAEELLFLTQPYVSAERVRNGVRCVSGPPAAAPFDSRFLVEVASCSTGRGLRRVPHLRCQEPVALEAR